MVGFPTHGSSSHRRKQRVACLAFPAGTKLFDSEHPSRRIYLLCSGRLQVSSDREVILDHLKRGDLFGEKHLLSSRRVHQVAKTLSPAKVVVLRKAEFFQRLRRDRRFAQQVIKNLVLRMDRYEETIRDFATEPTERRLALALFRLAPTRPATGWLRLPWSPTNPELAKLVGTTRWRISHFLNRFQRLGWVRRQEGLWVQREGLQAFLQSTAPPAARDAPK
jgi:CRP/FNR family transcriptional regulator, cyclic AMP receptor protein